MKFNLNNKLLVISGSKELYKNKCMELSTFENNSFCQNMKETSTKVTQYFGFVNKVYRQ